MKKLVNHIFFPVLTLKIKFAGIFIIIFVISASKYVDIVSFKVIGGKCFPEVYSKLVCTDILLIMIMCYLTHHSISFRFN